MRHTTRVVDSQPIDPQSFSRGRHRSPEHLHRVHSKRPGIFRIPKYLFPLGPWPFQNLIHIR